MALVHLQIDAENLKSIGSALSATDTEMNKALNSTLIKMAGWLRSQSVKGLSSVLNIQQKVIRRRLKSCRLQQRASRGSKITVWYGLNPIALIYLQAKQDSRGVSASGGRFVASAFIARSANGKRQVFKRRSKPRLPLDKQLADIKDSASRYIEDQLINTAEFESRFFTLFEHELKWRMQTP